MFFASAQANLVGELILFLAGGEAVEVLPACAATLWQFAGEHFVAQQHAP